MLRWIPVTMVHLRYLKDTDFLEQLERPEALLERNQGLERDTRSFCLVTYHSDLQYPIRS